MMQQQSYDALNYNFMEDSANMKPPSKKNKKKQHVFGKNSDVNKVINMCHLAASFL